MAENDLFNAKFNENKVLEVKKEELSEKKNDVTDNNFLIDKVTDKKTSQKAKNKREYQLKYFEDHKDKLKEKIVCDQCGHAYTRYNKSRHVNSKTHKNAEFINKINAEMNNLRKITENINTMSDYVKSK